jgi:vitamin B12 transporter
MMTLSNKYIYALILSFQLCSLHTFGQEITLDSVVIVASKPADITQPRLKINQSSIQSATIKDAIESVSSGIVQMQSPGGLQTFLHKGLPARHLPVLWQDINLLSALNGVTDLSLIPVRLFEDVSLFDFGSTTTIGSQSVSGGLLIKNKINAGRKICAFLDVSSLQNYKTGVSYRWQKNQQKHSVGLAGNFDKNIFTYTYNQQRQKTTATNYRQLHLVHDSKWNLGTRHSMTMNTWLSTADRRISNSITSAQTNQKQQDQSIRTQVSHHYYNSRYILKSSLSYINEVLHYLAPSIYSKANSNTVQAKIQWVDNLAQSLNVFLVARYDLATPNFYIKNQSRTLYQLGGTKRWKTTSGLVSQLAITQDWVSNKLQPTAGNAQLEYKGATLRFAKTYQLPALNDLYWPDGGNANLLPEQSLQYEFSYKTSHLPVDIKANIFSNHVNNWILWAPQSSGRYTPSNIQKVWSRGATIHVSKSKLVAKGQLELHTEVSYTRSEVRKHEIVPTIRGSQLIYIPKYKVVTGGHYTYAKNTFFGNWITVSKRFDNAANTTSLRLYSLVDIGYKRHFGAYSCQLIIQNLLNTKYEIVRYFAMPGISSSIIFIYQPDFSKQN